MSQEELRWGFTTGTCGAAAALAAAVLLFEGEELPRVRVMTPKGKELTIPIQESVLEHGQARCGVIKDSGDDPDVTNGALVLAAVSWKPEEDSGETLEETMSGKEGEAERLESPEDSEEAEKPESPEDSGGAERLESPEDDGGAEKPKSSEEARGREEPEGRKAVRAGTEMEAWYCCSENSQEAGGEEAQLFLRGGKGIGIVTREGLDCPPGMWAINPVPRQMIFEQVRSVCRRCHITGKVYITIEIPDGEELAKKTMNPHLGIVGGLSVLGTSGIVEPMSETALMETIRLEIRQKQAQGQRNLLVVPGNYGEQFVSHHLGMGLEQGIKCSNFIGASIDYALEAGVEGMLFVGHAGKLLKLAAGVMNTHSSMADGRMECLAAYGAACGAPREMVCRILSCITVEEAFGILEEAEGLLEAVMEVAMDRIYANLKRRAKNQMMVEAILFTNDRGILGTTPGAVAMMGKM